MIFALAQPSGHAVRVPPVGARRADDQNFLMLLVHGARAYAGGMNMVFTLGLIAGWILAAIISWLIYEYWG